MIDKYWKNRAFDYLLKNDFSIAEEYEEYLAEKNKNDKKKKRTILYSTRRVCLDG